MSEITPPTRPAQPGAMLPFESQRIVVLSPRARALIPPGTEKKQVSARFLQRGMYVELVRYLAHRFPPQQSVWWGCLCVRWAGGVPLPPKEEEALQATLRWVLDPNETTRLAAGKAGILVPRTPAGILARAAFSITAPPFRTEQLVGAAILRAAASRPIEQRKDVYCRMLAFTWGVRNNQISFESIRAAATHQRPSGVK